MNSREELTQKVLDVVVDETGVNGKDITRKSKITAHVEARVIFCMMLRLFGYTLKEIQTIVGLNHHSCVFHLLNTHDDRYQYNRKYKYMYDKVKNSLDFI